MNPRPIIYLLSALAGLFVLTSCKDTPEKVTRDFIEQYDELSLILNKTSSGELSSHEAVQDIEQWKEKMRKLIKRRDDLYQDDPYKDDFGAYLDEIDSSTLSDHKERLDVCEKAMRNLRASGKLTSAIESAIINDNSNGELLVSLWAMSGTGMTPTHLKAYSTRSSGTRIELEYEDIPEEIISELKKTTNDDEK